MRTIRLFESFLSVLRGEVEYGGEGVLKKGRGGGHARRKSVSGHGHKHRGDSAGTTTHSREGLRVFPIQDARWPALREGREK